MTFYTRAMWGAAPPKQTTPWGGGMPNSLTVHAVGGIVGLHDVYLEQVKSIQAHAFGKGLSDIDYSFLVDYHGNIYEGRGASWQSGAQGVGNATSMSVCYLDYGDGDVPFTQDAKNAILAIRGLYVHGNAVYPHRHWNDANTAAGHSDYVTACPGNEIAAWCDAVTSGTLDAGAPDMPLTATDYEGMKATVGNYVLTTLQNNIKNEYIPAIVKAVTAAVVAKLPAGSVDVQTQAKANADELHTRLGS